MSGTNPTIVSQAVQNGPHTYAFGLAATPIPAGQTSVTQAQAFLVPALVNVFSNVPPGGTCVLPTNVYLTDIEIINVGNNILTILPGPSWRIWPNAVNAGVSIAAFRGSARFLSGDPQGIAGAIWYAR